MRLITMVIRNIVVAYRSQVLVRHFAPLLFAQNRIWLVKVEEESHIVNTEHYVIDTQIKAHQCEPESRHYSLKNK